MNDYQSPTLDDGIELGRVGRTRLRFGSPNLPDHRLGWVVLPVAIEGPGVSAKAQLDLEEWGGGAVGFVGYFESLAAAWRGWAGDKEWEDDQGQVRLISTHDGLGSAFIQVTLHRFPQRDLDEEWSVHAVVAEDAGRLERVAAGLRALVATATR